MSYHIAIDCPPGSARPDVILDIVLEGTELVFDDFKITNKFFGEWTFILSEDKNDIYMKYKQHIGDYLRKLNGMGCVRYAEWS